MRGSSGALDADVSGQGLVLVAEVPQHLQDHRDGAIALDLLLPILHQHVYREAASGLALLYALGGAAYPELVPHVRVLRHEDAHYREALGGGVVALWVELHRNLP